MSKKHNIEFIKSEFKKDGYILLANEYTNGYQKLDYICPNNHKHKIRWHDWHGGRRCPYCANRPPIDMDKVKLEFEKEGYIFLTKNYKNAHQKLKYVCSKGHNGTITWNKWNIGCRCIECSRIKQAIKITGDKHPNWKGGISCEPYCDVWLDKDFKESIKERDGYKCLNPDCWGNCDHLPLHIHHIDHNKKNCEQNNLITLCASCNTRANYDREWWECFYKTIMEKRFSKEVI